MDDAKADDGLYPEAKGHVMVRDYVQMKTSLVTVCFGAMLFNAKADIKTFLEEFGYVQKASICKWARYKKGESVYLVTEGNTFKDVTSGETGNLFKFIEREHGKPESISQTEFFIRRVSSNPIAERRIRRGNKAGQRMSARQRRRRQSQNGKIM